MGEAVCIALAGGLIGVLLAAFITTGATKAGAGNIVGVNSLALTPFTVLVSLAIAILIGFVSSFIPAWNAARTTILDSLGYTG